MTKLTDGRGREISEDSLPRIAAGTMASTDLNASREFYEQFLGFECVRYAPKKMLIRDAASRRAMEMGAPNFMVIEVEEVAEIVHPQNMLNHWGLSVVSPEEVDRLHAVAQAMQEKFGLRKVQRITNIHGAYGFYFADRDMNWWEIEYRAHGLTNNMVFERGDFKAGARE